MSPIDDLLARLRDPAYEPWQFAADAAATIERLVAAGDKLDAALMASHPAFHGTKCTTCAALNAWWHALNPDAAWAVNL